MVSLQQQNLLMQAAYHINLKEQYSSKNDKRMVTIQIHSNLPFKIYSSLLLLLLYKFGDAHMLLENKRIVGAETVM